MGGLAMKKWTLSSLLLFLFLSACGTGSTNPDEQTPTMGNGEENKVIIENPENVSEADLKSTVAFHAGTFIFTIENDTGTDVDIVFSSGQEFDYVVHDSSGAKVKQLSEGMMYTQAIRETLLAAGDSLTYKVPMEEVTDDLPNGAYTITFLFTADKHAQATTEFNVAD